MNILYLANPSSIHDLKWVTFFSENNQNNVYLLPRKKHIPYLEEGLSEQGITALNPISDFSFSNFVRTIFTARRIKSIINQKRIDLIHILYAEPNSLWCLFRNYFNIPMIVSTRGTDVLMTIPIAMERKGLINKVVAPAYKKAFIAADWITCTSTRQIEAVSLFSNRTKNISVIRTGVDLNKLDSKNNIGFPLLNKSKYILFPRYMFSVYNHEFCLNAIKLLPMSFKKQYAMVFIGKDAGDPTYQRRIESQMGAIESAQFVFLQLQSQESMFALYKNASLVVMTPHSDGAPVSAMEALLCGAKLILGPLQYDEDLFSTSTIILKGWSAEELAEVMIQVLTERQTNLNLSPETVKLMDRTYNMKNMNDIYCRLL